MKNIKLVIFDLDGTLVDAYQAIIKSFNFTMQKLHYPKQDDLAIRKAVGWGDAFLLKPFVNPKDLFKALTIYRAHHAKSLLRHSRLFPGASYILGYLKKKGYKLAVASNRPTKFSLILIRHLGIASYFDFVLCADKLKRLKPDPEILKRIMQRFKVKPKEAFYVGDMAIDAQAGRRCGIKTIIVTTGSSTRGQIKAEKPFKIILGLRELLKLL